MLTSTNLQNSIHITFYPLSFKIRKYSVLKFKKKKRLLHSSWLKINSSFETSHPRLLPQRGIGWRGRWEGGSGWGTHVNPWLIHVNAWQKPLQYCKVISLQLIKINGKNINKVWEAWVWCNGKSQCNATPEACERIRAPQELPKPETPSSCPPLRSVTNTPRAGGPAPPISFIKPGSEPVTLPCNQYLRSLLTGALSQWALTSGTYLSALHPLSWLWLLESI